MFCSPSNSMSVTPSLIEVPTGRPDEAPDGVWTSTQPSTSISDATAAALPTTVVPIPASPNAEPSAPGSAPFRSSSADCLAASSTPGTHLPSTTVASTPSASTRLPDPIVRYPSSNDVSGPIARTLISAARPRYSSSAGVSVATRSCQRRPGTLMITTVSVRPPCCSGVDAGPDPPVNPITARTTTTRAPIAANAADRPPPSGVGAPFVDMSVTTGPASARRPDEPLSWARSPRRTPTNRPARQRPAP